jgi:colanic acid biosynthesis glycosyl transferase WcaI
MGRILFVNRFYWPDTPATGQLLTDLASRLAQTGHRVVVITSGIAGMHPSTETHDGVEITRVRTPRWAQTTVAGKALSFVVFFVGAGWLLFRGTQTSDTVVVMTDPPLFGIVAAMIARMKRARLIHWLQDIYPEIAIAVTGHRWLRGVKPWRDAAWRRADACITLSGEMTDVVRRAGVAGERIHTIPNWPPAGLVAVDCREAAVTELRREWCGSAEFVIGYSGNLGRVHDLAPIISAADLLREEDHIRFVFIGTGAQRRPVEADVARRGLRNVAFVPSQPRDRLSTSLAVADVHLVTLRPGCERYVFPSKLYGVAAIGRPVLFVGPPACELARRVLHERMGRVADRDHPTQIAEAIRDLAGNRAELMAQSAAAARFGAAHDFERAYTAWSEVFATPALAGAPLN